MRSQLQQLGNYVIDREIGRGATSEVWLAHHAYLEHRQVAVKILLTQDVETIHRFSHEANIMGLLRHDHIVQIYDHGHNDPYYYTVLQYVNGNSLQQLLDRKRTIDFATAIAIFQQIATALDFAHSLDIVHRDVSPGNILVDEVTGCAFLTDFGIARDPTRKITVDQRVMGTPGYWSPEHARSATEVTSLSDIYGLGVVLYVMLTGELPWNDVPGTPDQGFDPPMLVKQRGAKHIPEQVDAVIRTMLAADPLKRFPTAQAAVDELDRLLKRHHAATQVYDTRQTVRTDHQMSPHPTVMPSLSGCQVAGVLVNEVETVLGPNLVRAPIAQAHKRAQELCQPDAIVNLLNAWSHEGAGQGFFRKQLLGRMANLHSIKSRNLYFYRLRVLYEQRSIPEEIMEPDKTHRVYPLEPEQGQWEVALPSVQGFEQDEGDQIIIPGSTRVVTCSVCGGKGKTVCPKCKGAQRIKQRSAVPIDDEEEHGESSTSSAPNNSSNARGRNRQGNAGNQDASGRASGKAGGTGKSDNPHSADPSSAPSGVAGMIQMVKRASRTRMAEIVVPCPECEGRGGIPCEQCEGTGRMVAQKALRWQRVPYTIEDHDELPVLDSKWLLEHCSIEEVYHERAMGDPFNNTPAFLDEWLKIPRVVEMIEQVQEVTDEETRIILSELSIGMIPITDVVLDLGNAAHTAHAANASDGEPETPDENHLYDVTIFGNEHVIPADWRFLDWNRVILVWGGVFAVALILIFAFFALTGC